MKTMHEICILLLLLALFLSGCSWVEDDDIVKILNAYQPSYAIETPVVSASVVSGDQSTIIIIANFTNATVTSTPSQIHDLMFSDPNGYSIDALFRETSFGNVSFSGQVVGPFTINYSTASACDYAAWANAADAAATLVGVDLSAYQHHIYVMPSTEMGVCGADGAGQLGGSPSRAWVFNYTMPDVYAHELGHNLGMGHSATPVSAYSDVSDDMSINGYPLRHFNAPHMVQMGWMPASNIATLTQSGTYTVAALELAPLQSPAPQILKIWKPDTGEYYYLSYREPIGFDAGLLTGYLNRVHVHKHLGGSYNTYRMALLDDSSVFNDATNGITVTQVSHTGDRATVMVQFGAIVPPPPPPPPQDTQPPSAPTGITASISQRVNLSLTWVASTDNVGVTGYEVWRNGVKIATKATTGYAETLTNGSYTYYVIAYDAAGNRSNASNSVTVKINRRGAK